MQITPPKTRTFLKAALAGQATICQQVNTSLKTSISYKAITLGHDALWFRGNFQPGKVYLIMGWLSPTVQVSVQWWPAVVRWLGYPYFRSKQ